MAPIATVCVYCGSSGRAPLQHLEAAYRLGGLIAAAGMRVVFGGGGVGLMGRLADGVLTEGGRIMGVIPRHLHELEVAHPGVTDLLIVETLHERKQAMAERADAFVILPGGFGTLDETFEIVTWRQLGLHDKPIVLADLAGYWQPLRGMIRRIVDERFAATGEGELFVCVDNVDLIIPALLSAGSGSRSADLKRT